MWRGISLSSLSNDLEKWVGASFLFLVSNGCIAVEQVHCDKSLLELSKSAKPPFAYAIRNGYCDGAVAAKHAGQLEVVSATVGQPIFDNTEKFVISVRQGPVRAVAKGDEREVILVVATYRGPTAYRLDAKLVGSRFEFDTRPALLPLKIRADELGFLATSTDDGGRFYIPVDATQGVKKATHLRVVLRAPVDLTVIKATYSPGMACQEPMPCIIGRDADSGKPIVFELPLNEARGIVLVRFSAVDAENKVFGLALRFRVDTQ